MGDSCFIGVCVRISCACVCFVCFSGRGTVKVFSSTSTDGCWRWRRGAEGDEGRSLHEGSVSMVTPHPLSAPLKAVLRQQMSVSLGTLGGRGGGVVEGGRVERGAGGGT